MIKNEEERKKKAKRAEDLMDKEMLTLEESEELEELLAQVDKFEDDNYSFD